MPKLSGRFYPNHFISLMVFALGLIILLIISRTVLNGSGIYVLLLGVMAVLAVVLIAIKRVERAIFQNYRQLEALGSINSIISLRHPWPRMRKWAASPDFLCEVAKITLRNNPEISIEMGSGVSTVLIGYLLEKNGTGKHIALDHDPTYADKTRQLLRDHTLAEVAEVRNAPLRPVELSGDKYEWYEQGQIPDCQIDLLVIDGPPRALGENARYPALPLLLGQLRSGAYIIVDDANSRNVSRTINRWKSEFDCLSFQRVDVEKGAYIIRVDDKRCE